MSIDIPSYLSAAAVPSVAASGGCDGSSACESGTFQSCSGQCQGCQVYTQCSGCQTTCEVGCQLTCQTSCQGCQGVSCQSCQSTCETSCQNCQGASCQTCQTGCQIACQNCQGVSCQTCQSSCQSTCQNCQGSACQACQSSCQYTCQSTCEVSCQNCQGASCQTCQSACESQVQVVDNYAWQFNPVSAGSNGLDTKVRGIWSGFVGGSEVLCAACNGYLWELKQGIDGWTKTACGQLDTTQDVFMFGFSEKLYILNGSEYKVWDGTALENVEGYRPLVTIATLPTGGGTTLEQVNKLTGARRAWYSPDGTATEFVLPEEGTVNYVKSTATGEDMTGWTSANNKVTFTTAPAQGVNSIEIGWTVPSSGASLVKSMRYGETFNGAQDTRVFLYGDGTNKAIYSGLDYDGQPRADYFPDTHEMEVGDANTPITSMLRLYGRLMVFKLDSTYNVYYNSMTLVDGSTTAGFFVTPVNRDIGNCAPGQARLVENRPRTLDGRSVIEWKATVAYANAAGDQTNAHRISQRVDSTIRTFDLATAKTFYDKVSHEYYVIGANGTALVHNVDADAWYIYTGFAATCLIRYKDELYYGTSDGWLRHCSDDYFSDEGLPIDAYWESGSMPFDRDYKRKYSAMIWLGIKPEDKGFLNVTAETDIKSDFAQYSFTTDSAQAVPKMNRIKLKAKKFTYYKLILSNNTADTTATVVSADIRVRNTGYVR